MIWRVRRVLTGHDAQGRSTFIADGEAANVKEMASMPGLALTDLWETGGAPASNAGGKDAAARPVRLEPPKNGTLLRVVEFPPDSAWRGSAVGINHPSVQFHSPPPQCVPSLYTNIHIQIFVINPFAKIW